MGGGMRPSANTTIDATCRLAPTPPCTLQDERTSAAPDIPTAIEQGFPDIVADNWFGLLAPAGTPEIARSSLVFTAYEINRLGEVSSLKG